MSRYKRSYLYLQAELCRDTNEVTSIYRLNYVEVQKKLPLFQVPVTTSIAVRCLHGLVHYTEYTIHENIAFSGTNVL
jgi:hypothetical protein